MDGVSEQRKPAPTLVLAGAPPEPSPHTDAHEQGRFVRETRGRPPAAADFTRVGWPTQKSGSRDDETTTRLVPHSRA